MHQLQRKIISIFRLAMQSRAGKTIKKLPSLPRSLYLLLLSGISRENQRINIGSTIVFVVLFSCCGYLQFSCCSVLPWHPNLSVTHRVLEYRPLLSSASSSQQEPFLFIRWTVIPSKTSLPSVAFYW